MNKPFNIHKENHFNWFRALKLQEARQRYLYQKKPDAASEPSTFYKETKVRYIDAYFELKKTSSSWTTCACGNLCDAIPRAEGKPLDDILANEGQQFYTCVGNEDYPEALKALYRVEERAIQVLTEMGVINVG